MHLFRILGQDAFRDLHMEEIPGNVVFLPGIFHQGKNIQAGEIIPGQIEGNRGDGQAGIQPLADGAAHFFQHIGIQPVNLPGLFQHRDEGGRGKDSRLGVHPSGQGLQTAQIPCKGTDHRLIIHLDPVVFQCLLQVLENVLSHTVCCYHSAISPAFSTVM